MNNNGYDNFESYDFLDNPYGSDVRNDRDVLDSNSRSGGSSRSASGGNRSRSGGSNRSASGTNRSRSGGSNRSASGGNRSRSGASHTPRTEIREETSPRSSYQSVEDDEKLPVSVFIGIGVTVLAIVLLIVSIIANSNRAKHKRAGNAGDMLSDSDIVSAEFIDEPDDIEVVDDDPVVSQPAFKSFIGTWYKEDVHASDKAILTITMQYQDSFEFRLEIWNGSESAVISDTAFYDSKKTTDDVTVAEYSPKKKTALTFRHDGTAIEISHTGKNSVFGIGDKFAIDGRFTEEEPKYIVDEPENNYDYYLYQSDSVVSALKETLSSEDYKLYQKMMDNGLKSPIEYERTTDKNGELVNVDPELNAVKYYAYLPDQAMDMIFICTEDAKIYLLFYDSSEIIYCTNDSKYASKMPESFQAVAKAKGITPTYR